MDPYTREKIENWVGDFAASEVLRRFPGGIQEYAGEVLVTLLVAACDAGGRDPGELTEADLRTALLDSVAPLALPESVRTGVPDLAAALLEYLEAEGRVADGRALGLFVRALRRPFLDAASGKQRPDRRPAAKVRANDPCPCGSGVKFKKCCRGGL